MNKKIIKDFLLNKRGYIKKSPSLVLENLLKYKLIKISSSFDIENTLDIITSTQKDLRKKNKSEKNSIHEKYFTIINSDRNIRRLFFDIEVSPNIVLSWKTGEVILSPDNIVKERAIICISYKWEHENNVKSLRWKNGDDRDMLIKFSQVISSADEIVTQNGDSFDIKWVRTRCLYHSIPFPLKFNSIDTLKMARSGFKFNSNKLDYIGKFLSEGEKIKTSPELWTNILLNSCNKSLNEMVNYCNQDVLLLEKIYKRLQEYSPKKKFKYNPL